MNDEVKPQGNETQSTRRRAKIFWLDEGHIMALFSNGWSDIQAQVLRVPVNQKLPAGATVRNCFYDAPRNAFGFVVEHESFAEVETCFALPGEILRIEDFRVKEIPFLSSK